jgi:hypothetical protein
MVMRTNNERDFKVFLFHIPKTGGTSIHQTDGVYKRYHYSGAVALQGQTDYIQSLPRVAVVRNPWDRAVSEYFWLITQGMGGNWFKATAVKAAKTAGSFDAWIGPWLRGQIHIAEYHRNPQWTFLDCPDINILRFETLNNDWKTFCNSIDFHPEPLGRKFKTKHEHYSKYYTNETRKMLAQFYARDIEEFGYDF